MIVPDSAGVDREHYDWAYKGQDLLGDVICWVFDLRPAKGAGYGAFIGRIWVTEKDLAIIRFDGTYTSAPKKASPYLRFISVRLKNKFGLWVPAAVHVEAKDLAKPINGSSSFQARVSIWGYQPQARITSEISNLRLPKGQILTQTNDPSRVQGPNERDREREDNVLEWMEAAGLLAPFGNVEGVLETVVNNILATNNMSYRPPIRCRILLTTPLESFRIGGTIVVSKGLVDVLPDEAGLALVLAPELAQILFDRNVDTKFGFHDLFLADEPRVLKELDFHRATKNIEDVDTRAIELLGKSPYKQQMSSAALFLYAATQSCRQLPGLFQPLFGNGLPGCGRLRPISRLQELASLDIEHAAALPLGARIVVDPWSGMTEMVKPPLVTAPFQLIPMMLNPKEDDDPRDPAFIPPAPKVHVPASPARK